MVAPHDLDGDGAIEAELRALVHRAHPATPDEALHRVVAVREQRGEILRGRRRPLAQGACAFARKRRLRHRHALHTRRAEAAERLRAQRRAALRARGGWIHRVTFFYRNPAVRISWPREIHAPKRCLISSSTSAASATVISTCARTAARKAGLSGCPPRRKSGIGAAARRIPASNPAHPPVHAPPADLSVKRRPVGAAEVFKRCPRLRLAALARRENEAPARLRKMRVCVCRGVLVGGFAHGRILVSRRGAVASRRCRRAGRWV